MSRILVKAEPPLSNKILIRKEIAVQQIVGGGTKPTFGDMYGAFRGRGTKPGTKVGIGGRLRGLAGMAGKTAAAAVTAQQTAEAMQGGNLGAPLQAGVTYQGMDPTATMNPNIAQQIEGTKAPETTALPPAKFPKNMQPNTTGPRTGAVGIAPTNNTSTSSVYQTPTYGNFTTNSPPQLTRGPYDNTGLVPPASPLQPTQTQTPSANEQLLSTLNGPNTTGSTELYAPYAPPPVAPVTPVAPVAPGQTRSMGNVLAQQQLPVQAPVQAPGQTESMGNFLAQQQQITMAFTDTVFDKLGPDMVYKMTPHHIATLSAYMYLKLN